MQVNILTTSVASSVIYDEQLDGKDLTTPLTISRVAAIQNDVIIWSTVDGFLVVTIVCGNVLTILAVRYSRRLRSIISNLFILSLAISDMIVGFTLPYHLAFYVGTKLGNVRFWCILRFFLIILACCVSIWNLMAIAVDRYIAICYPLHYTRYITRKAAVTHVGIGWVLSFFIAIIPVFWNNFSTASECEFDEVLPKWYLGGIITPIFSIVWICLLLTYSRILQEASKHAKQMRVLHDRASDWKSVQVCVLVLGCFTLCWIPYFVVAMVQMFDIFDDPSPKVYKICFTLAMTNSGINPLIYAWKNTAFRKAFARLLRCKMPDRQEQMDGFRSNVNRKSSSIIQNNDMFNCSRAEMMGTPTSRGRQNSTDTESAFEPIPMDGPPRESISDSGVIVIIKHPRLSSISSEHRQSQNTINEESISNQTTMVTFSSSQDSESYETPKRRVSIDSAFDVKNPTLKIIRNKCAVTDSYDSMSDESPVKFVKNNYNKNKILTASSPLSVLNTTSSIQKNVPNLRPTNFHFNFKKYFRSKQTPVALRKNPSNLVSTYSRNTSIKNELFVDENGHIRSEHAI
uniref:CSON000459 protein n=1 Tax=Culicoides sonorensis TaxID=179676 RepID=A0A336LTV7_CULSO